jgi:ribosomal protein S18 acetylase RimI-like enzyme
MPREGLSPPAPPSDLKIRKARSLDAAALARLEETIFPSDRMSRRRFAALAKRPSARILVAWLGDEIAGYAILLTRRGIRTGRLYSLAVAPWAAGRGIGALLLSAIESTARQRRVRQLRLEVRKDNRRAIRLYEGSGYRRIGERPEYYGDGMTALLYARDLAAAEPAVGRPMLRAA